LTQEDDMELRALRTFRRLLTDALGFEGTPPIGDLLDRVCDLRTEVLQLQEDAAHTRAVMSIPEVYAGMVSEAVSNEIEYYQRMARDLQDQLSAVMGKTP